MATSSSDLGRAPTAPNLSGSREARPVLPRPVPSQPADERPILARSGQSPKARGRQPSARQPRRSGRPVRLMTLDREPSPRAPRRRRSGPAASQRTPHTPLGLQDWMAALLRDRSTLQLDSANICMVLHALWKKPARREVMLRDPDFRQKAFNAFVMDALKGYQAYENSEEDDISINVVKNGNRKTCNDDDDEDPSKDEPDGSAAVSVADAADPSDPLWEPPADGNSDGSDDEWRPGASDGGDSRDGSPDPPPRKKRGPPRRHPSPDGDDAESGAARRHKYNLLYHSWKLRDPPADGLGSADLCSRIEGILMRTSGRRLWMDDNVVSLAKGEEDTSGVPASSFLFIRCTRCPELSFVDYAALRHHWQQVCHFLSCVLCDMIFNTAQLALAHLRISHKEPVPEGWFRLVRCHPCGRGGFFSTEQVIGHMASHRAERARNPAVFPPFLTCYKPIICNQCGQKKLHHRGELFDRYKRDPPEPCRHEPGWSPQLSCPGCRRVWAGPAALAAHIRCSQGLCRTALPPLGEPSSSKGSRLRNLDMSKGMKPGCPVCRRAMEPGELLLDHLLTHLAPGLRCVQCSLVTSSHQQMRDHWAFTWRCDCAACDTHVGRGSRLLQHIIEDHDGGRRLTSTDCARPRRDKPDCGTCPTCGKFSTRLKHHHKLRHETRHCPCCDKVVNMGTFFKHRSNIKNLEKLRCQVCSRTFSSAWAQRVHMRLHTGEKPYKCDLCDAAYAQKVELKLHMRNRHDLDLPAAKPGTAAVTGAEGAAAEAHTLPVTWAAVTPEVSGLALRP